MPSVAAIDGPPPGGGGRIGRLCGMLRGPASVQSPQCLGLTGPPVEHACCYLEEPYQGTRRGWTQTVSSDFSSPTATCDRRTRL